MTPRTLHRTLLVLPALLAGVASTLVSEPEAQAIPSFARKYQASCQTCHTVYPVLNSFGEAFRRNGYRFPRKNGSLDSDVEKAPTIAMGQEEYKKTFPNSIWPSKIADAIPLSAWVLGGVSVNLPNSDAHNVAGNIFTWNNILKEAHLFGAGSFSDTMTYFTQLTFSGSGVDIETGYLLWNDIVGPDHLVNLWVGRLFAPQLTSYGLHSDYLNDTYMPATSVAGLYNPGGNFALGQGHSDGIEINGVAAHRFDYSLGWLASLTTNGGLKVRSAEEVYAHMGVKIGGMSLDGEGASAEVADAKKPWAETSLTADVFAYHGMTTMDNGTGAPVPMPQNDKINAIGGSLHLNVGSLVVVSGLQYEQHGRPYPGAPPTAPNPPNQPNALPGSPNFSGANSWQQFNEVDYLIYPWLVPGVRTEYTNIDLEPAVGGGVNTFTKASLLRVVPGVAIALRANVKLVLLADFELAHGLPPVGTWGAANGAILAPQGQSGKFEAETIRANFAWAF